MLVFPPVISALLLSDGELNTEQYRTQLSGSVIVHLIVTDMQFKYWISAKYNQTQSIFINTFPAVYFTIHLQHRYACFPQQTSRPTLNYSF